MALEEYKRKRNFNQTPEPGPDVEAKSQHRFVVQKHRATRLHYDFRLEMEGVLKSWAVPKGPSLDPADKRLAMEVEDHPVSYIHFEGIIPEDNYGAGTVMVWDTGTWEAEGNASEMLRKGDLKFSLNGEKLKGSFVLAKMRSRRPGSKGNEWLLIKHRDEFAMPGYNADDHDYSVLSQRSLAEIAADEDSAEWQSSRPAATSAREKDWLHESIAVADAKKATATVTRTKAKSAASERKPTTTSKRVSAAKSAASTRPKAAIKKKSNFAEQLEKLKGAEQRPMPTAIHPMLATLIDQPFNSADWLYEIKLDGYRAVAFLDSGKLRLVSRNGNEMTAQYPELAEIATHVRATQAIIDGEVVALDDQGRPSFSMMQQRTGIRSDGKMGSRNPDIPILYYAFDLIYLDGYDLRRVDLQKRKEVLTELLLENEILKYSDHFEDGRALYEAAKAQGLEGIIAKRKNSCYVEKRTREWLKMKITQMQECVIGGYTDPRGGREHFGSIILGLYDDKGRLIHVGQAGSGFTERTHADMWKRLQKLEIAKSPFTGKVESNRRTHWVKPEMVAQIKFTEWTHEGQSGSVKMRAPVFIGLREDKNPEDCRFEKALRTAASEDAA